MDFKGGGDISKLSGGGGAKKLFFNRRNLGCLVYGRMVGYPMIFSRDKDLSDEAISRVGYLPDLSDLRANL